jgi:hypothetical protein
MFQKARQKLVHTLDVNNRRTNPTPSARAHLSRRRILGVSKSSISPPPPSHQLAPRPNTTHNGLTDTPRPLRQEARPILQHRRCACTVRPPPIPPRKSAKSSTTPPQSQPPPYHLFNTPLEQPATPALSKSSAPTIRNHKPRDPATHTAGHGKTFALIFRAHGTGLVWVRSQATQRGDF